MPATTAKQRRFFGFLIGNPAERRRRGVSLALAREMARKPRRRRRRRSPRLSIGR